MSDWKSHILPHSDLISLNENLWLVTGSIPRKVGKLPRNMIVYRMQSGGLWIHSAVAMDEPRMKQLESLGRPEVMMVPNRMHRLDAGVYKERYPSLRVVCPRAAIGAVSKIVAVEGAAEDELEHYGMRCHSPEGIRPEEVCVELSVGEQRALVMTDLLFNLRPTTGIDGVILKLLGCVGFFGMTPVGRMMLLQDRSAFAAWLVQMAELPRLAVICVGHGDTVTQNCAEHLRKAAQRLTK